MPGLDRKCEGVGMREQQSLDHLCEFLTILFCIGISSAYKAISQSFTPSEKFGINSFHSHFADEETEVSRGRETYPMTCNS